MICFPLIATLSGLLSLFLNIYYHTRVLESHFLQCRRRPTSNVASSLPACTCSKYLLLPHLRVITACVSNPLISSFVFALDIPRLIVSFVAHWLPSAQDDADAPTDEPPLSPPSTVLTPPPSHAPNRPSVPRLNLFGLAPPIVGYGVAAAGESPATTSTRTLSSYRLARYRRPLSKPGQEPISSSSASTPHIVTGSSSRDSGVSTSDRPHEGDDEIRSCIVLACVILGGLFVLNTDSEIPIHSLPESARSVRNRYPYIFFAFPRSVKRKNDMEEGVSTI